MRRWLADHRSDMVEGALTFSLMALVALAAAQQARPATSCRSR